MTRWGEEKTLYFIILYRNHECLWNVRSPLYKNKIARNNAYQSLLESLNDDSLNVKGVKTKIKNLRSMYHTELKKINDSKCSGRDGSVYKPSLSWFCEMHSFLGDSIEYRETISSEIEIQEPSADNKELATQDTYESSLQQYLLDSQLIHNNSSAVDNNSDPLKQNTNETLQSGQQSMKTKLARKKRKQSDDSVLNNFQRFENKPKVVNTIPQELIQDEFYYFALSIAAQLRNMPLHTAIKAQSKIQKTLSAVRLSSIISNTSSPSSSYSYNS